MSSNVLPCPVNSKHNVVWVEYGWRSQNHYDGVSEIDCKDCKKRYGRWSKKVLAEGEEEPPYGRKKE